MSIERGNLLYQTGRYELAQQEFRAALAQEPDNALAHSMVGLCLLREKRYADATVEAQQAIQLRPDWAFGYATLASVLEERERLKEAIAAIERAIALDPFNPSNLATLGRIRLKQQKWSDALSAADRGLAIDPEHAGCVNARGIALVQLGRRDEASQTIQGALARDPQNAITHANQGWALLHSGDHRAAMEHFREALRTNPEMSWAKAGIVEAMKARNPIYRFMLRYFLLMSRLSARARWAIVLGGYFGYQIVRQLELNNPALRPVLLPIMIAYVVFVFMTWLAAPAFNLMLQLDRFGRYTLSRDQRAASYFFAACLATTITLGIAWLITQRDGLLIGTVLSGLLALPITSTFSCPKGWPRWIMAGYTAVLAGLSFLVVMLALHGSLDQPIGSSGFTPFNLFVVILWGNVLSSFLANAMVMTRVRK